MSKQKLFKNSPRMGGNDGHHELLCRILHLLEVQEHKLKHLIDHVHHLEELIVASGGSTGDQEKINAILAQTAQSKAKLQQALEAKPPASTEPGT